MGIRKMELSAECAFALNHILQRGPSSQGYSREQLKKVDPILNQIEDFLQVNEGKKIEEAGFCTLSMKQSEWELVKQILSTATGLFAGIRKALAKVEVIIEEAKEEPEAPK